PGRMMPFAAFFGQTFFFQTSMRLNRQITVRMNSSQNSQHRLETDSGAPTTVVVLMEFDTVGNNNHAHSASLHRCRAGSLCVASIYAARLAYRQSGWLDGLRDEGCYGAGSVVASRCGHPCAKVLSQGWRACSACKARRARCAHVAAAQ